MSNAPRTDSQRPQNPTHQTDGQSLTHIGLTVKGHKVRHIGLTIRGHKVRRTSNLQSRTTKPDAHGTDTQCLQSPIHIRMTVKNHQAQHKIRHQKKPYTHQTTGSLTLEIAHGLVVLIDLCGVTSEEQQLSCTWRVYQLNRYKIH